MFPAGNIPWDRLERDEDDASADELAPGLESADDELRADDANADPIVDPIVDRMRPLTRKGDSAARPAVVLAARPMIPPKAREGVDREARPVVRMTAPPKGG